MGTCMKAMYAPSTHPLGDSQLCITYMCIACRLHSGPRLGLDALSRSRPIPSTRNEPRNGDFENGRLPCNESGSPSAERVSLVRCAPPKSAMIPAPQLVPPVSGIFPVLSGTRHAASCCFSTPRSRRRAGLGGNLGSAGAISGNAASRSPKLPVLALQLAYQSFVRAWVMGSWGR